MISLYIGMPGTGKTTAMVDYVAVHSHIHRFFVVDRAAEWGEMEEGDSNPRWRGVEHTFVTVPYEVNQENGWQWFDERPSEGIFIFGHPWEGLEVAELAGKVGNVVYVDDEIDLVALFGGWQNNPLRNMVHRGRHFPNALGIPSELHILGAARRPQNLHPDLTAMADQAFIYRCQGKLTLNRLRDDSWLEDDELDKVRTLPNFHCRHWPSGGYLELKNPYK